MLSIPHGTPCARRWLVFTLLFLSPAVLSAAPPKAAPPNVVVITIDTLRADHLGCYGYRGVKTPNLDSLASGGVRFQNAFTPVPITLPAHSALMTGTYPTLNGI